MKAYILLAEGFEEVEALTPADILKRAGVEALFASPYGEEYVTGSHGITVKADVTELPEDGDAVILPGGKAGTANLRASESVRRMITSYAAAGKLVAAVCAAPSVLGAAGLLDGRKCTCYPGWESELGGKEVFVGGPAVTDGNIVTGKSMGCSVDFALAVTAKLCGEEIAGKVEDGIYRQ